jgi:hypothetical protein
MALAKAPPGGWSAWQDGKPLIEVVTRIRDGGWYDNFPHPEEFARSLEIDLVEMLRSGIDSDDLEQVSDAVEDGKRLLSKQFAPAMERAIEEEFEQASQRAAESDSEPTLLERTDTLTKLVPRAGVSTERIDRATTLIEDRRHRRRNR